MIFCCICDFLRLPCLVQCKGGERSAELGRKGCFIHESALWLADVQVLAVCRAFVATEKQGLCY